MEAKPITHKGMKFRSKLEARYFNHFSNLGWDCDYEPEVPDLLGYQPDFVLYPDKCRNITEFPEYKPIYVEIKPIRNTSNYYDDPNYDNFREKIKRCWNPKNDLLLFGSNLFNRCDHACMAISFENEIFDKLTSYSFNYSYSYDNPTDIGLVLWQDREYLAYHDNRSAIFSPRLLDNPEEGFRGAQKKSYDKVETSWNKAWSDLRWEPK